MPPVALAISVPPMLAVPVTGRPALIPGRLVSVTNVTLVRLAVDGETFTRYIAALVITRLPWMVSTLPPLMRVPPAIADLPAARAAGSGGPPGAKVPPSRMVVLGKIPLPPSVPPEFTVIWLATERSPSTSSVPPWTVQGFDWPKKPNTVQTPLTALKVVKP